MIKVSRKGDPPVRAGDLLREDVSDACDGTAWIMWMIEACVRGSVSYYDVKLICVSTHRLDAGWKVTFGEHADTCWAIPMKYGRWMLLSSAARNR